MVYSRLLEIAETNERVLVPSLYTSSLGTDYKAGNLFKSNATPNQRFYSSKDIHPSDFPRPQHMRAYNLWHHSDMALNDICAKLRSEENPLKESTVM